MPPSPVSRSAICTSCSTPSRACSSGRTAGNRIAFCWVSGARRIWTKDSRDFPTGCGLFGLTRSLREISEQPGQVTGAMYHPDDYRRIAIRGVDDQVWIAGQHDKTISHAASEIRATHANLGMFTDAFGSSEDGIEQPLGCNRIILCDPLHCALDITACSPGECCGRHPLPASMIA